jgi:hypothetical protein
MRLSLKSDWGVKSFAALRGLRQREDTRGKELLRVGETEIAGDCLEIRSPLILIFVDGLE